jgi:hypothetical protein
MKMPTRQIAYLRRYVSAGPPVVYDVPPPGTPFRCHGWATVKSDDVAADENTPRAWTELYLPTRPVHADTGETLDPIEANDLIVLPIEGPWVPEVPGGTLPGTPEKQRITISGSPWPDQFRLTFDGQPTATINATNTSTSDIAAKLNALANLDGVTVASGGLGKYDVTFGGANAGVDVPLLGYTLVSWGGGATISIATTQQAVPGESIEPTPGYASTLYVAHHVQGYRQDSNAGLTSRRAGSTLMLLRV